MNHSKKRLMVLRFVDALDRSLSLEFIKNKVHQLLKNQKYTNTGPFEPHLSIKYVCKNYITKNLILCNMRQKK